MIQGNGFSSSANIENLTFVDAENSGKDSIIFQIKFDEVPSGKEKFYIRPFNDNAVYDLGQNS